MGQGRPPLKAEVNKDEKLDFKSSKRSGCLVSPNHKLENLILNPSSISAVFTERSSLRAKPEEMKRRI
jgi:hypothetical protein